VKFLTTNNGEVLYSFEHSPSFNLNEWVYIGVSIYKTNRDEDTFDIHIVSKNILGIENESSFISQDLELDCNHFLNNLVFDFSNKNLFIIGGRDTVNFSGKYFFLIL